MRMNTLSPKQDWETVTYMIYNSVDRGKAPGCTLIEIFSRGDTQIVSGMSKM